MSDAAEHRERWQDDIAAYALDALPAREAAILESHLEECEACREQLLWLAPAVDQIPHDVEQKPAPPALRERLLAIVDEEAAVPRGEGESKPAAAPRRWLRFRLPGFGETGRSGASGIFRSRPALAGLAVTLLLVAGVVGYQLHDTGATNDGDDAPAQTFTAQAAKGMSSSSGSLEVEGDHGSLRVSGMPPTEGDDVYQAWIQDEDGGVHPSSTFVVAGDGNGVVSIPSGLEGAEAVMITREPSGGSETPSEAPVMTARLD